jgi:hypothetical protein
MTLLAFSFEPPLFNLSTYKHRHAAPVFFRAFFSVAVLLAPTPERGENDAPCVVAICFPRSPQSPAGWTPIAFFRLRSFLGLTPITSVLHARPHFLKRQKNCAPFSANGRLAEAPRNVARPPPASRHEKKNECGRILTNIPAARSALMVRVTRDASTEHCLNLSRPQGAPPVGYHRQCSFILCPPSGSTAWRGVRASHCGTYVFP